MEGGLFMENIEIMLLIVIALALVAIFVWGLVKYDKYWMQQYIRELEEENAKLSSQVNYDFIYRAEVSDKLLSFIEKTCAKVSLIKFQEFKDARDMTKLTKANVESLVSETALEVHSYVPIKAEDIDGSLYTLEFIDKYIIDTCIMNIKSLLNDHINNELL
jgi:hypothetical protein